MTSGAWITTYLLVSVFVVFPAWEFIQLARRRAGNRSARTLSQWVIHKAKNGSKLWRWFLIVFPIVLFFISCWLLLHFEGLCLNFGVGCEIDI